MAELKQHFGNDKVRCDLIEGGGGIFDVVLDGTRIYSKHETGRFPQYREIIKAIEEKIIRS